MNSRKVVLSQAVGGILSLTAMGANAQQPPPDAGQTLQELRTPLAPPEPSKGIVIQPSAVGVVLPGGQKAQITNLTFKGNTVFSTAELKWVLGDVEGKSFDLAGLQALVERVSDFYRSNDYPFARAALPPQDITQGNLTIEVIEGRYGQVSAFSEENDPETLEFIAIVQSYLVSLNPGAVITASNLERTTLLLEDLPGIDIRPVIRPGEAVGTGDLDVRLIKLNPLSGNVSIDNTGNRFTGYSLFKANVNYSSPFTLGDQLSAQLTQSDKDLFLGSLGYSIPIGTQGLRLTANYSETNYQLGREFELLGAQGKASTVSAGGSYPFIRSKFFNLSGTATIGNRKLEDQQELSNFRSDKESDFVSLAMSFDKTANQGYGGVTYGTFGITRGDLDLPAFDLDAANTRGRYIKYSLDVAHNQGFTQKTSGFIRLSAQEAQRNLDSSEGFTLGGFNGIRAYPSGEGSGDTGYYVQAELRWNYGSAKPFVFYDFGNVRTDAKGMPGINNSRSLAGAGLGIRFDYGSWGLESILAWRTRGGLPQADTSDDPKPRLWLVLRYGF